MKIDGICVLELQGARSPLSAMPIIRNALIRNGVDDGKQGLLWLAIIQPDNCSSESMELFDWAIVPMGYGNPGII
ncbi:MAG: hypothetical protein AAFY26_00185 [Cyanobacteria bacterium J06638_22]